MLEDPWRSLISKNHQYNQNTNRLQHQAFVTARQESRVSGNNFYSKKKNIKYKAKE